MKIIIGVQEETSFLPYQTFFKAPYRNGSHYVLMTCGGNLISGVSRIEVADTVRRAKACGLRVNVEKKGEQK